MSTQNERDLLEFGERIGRYGKVAPRPAFRAELRSALLAAPVSFEAPRASRLGWSRALATRLPEAAQRGIQRAIEVQQRVHGKSNFTPGRSGIPIAPTPGRGGPPSGVPGRP